MQFKFQGSPLVADVSAGLIMSNQSLVLQRVREGHGDMAVSNAIGSNVFDILVCLGLPWFLDTAIVNPTEYVKVTSKGNSNIRVCLC